ncbi:hypothetical protein KIN20_035847 [Parelaphostrongylus tenuis]|uniref:Uncharacterized protein n=1 Tax=Parelaphostrongylus tenuis TaxID=148309 RepID=A0AAD5WL83_PARTN|nr:hypothetical protein KIN20_035847 [Parelaphostrongylus tenuis]
MGPGLSPEQPISKETLCDICSLQELLDRFRYKIRLESSNWHEQHSVLVMPTPPFPRTFFMQYDRANKVDISLTFLEGNSQHP